MGMSLTQSSTFNQRRKAVWYLHFGEVMGWSRVAQRMTSTIAGKLTATANMRRVWLRRGVRNSGRAIPTATSLGNIMPRIGHHGGRGKENFQWKLRDCENDRRKDGSRAGSRFSSLAKSLRRRFRAGEW